MSETVNINFIVKGKVVKLDVPVGTTILEAAHNNDVDL